MVGDLTRFGLGTNIRPSSINPVVNDHLAERLATGKIVARPDIFKIYEDEVEVSWTKQNRYGIALT